MWKKPVLELVAPVTCAIELRADSKFTNEDWQRVLYDLKPFVVEIDLRGEEPVEHPQFLDVLQILDNFKIPVNIYSNGLWENPGELFKSIRKFGHIISFHIPVYGFKEATHELMGGKGTYSKVIENIKSAVTHNYDVHVDVPVGKFNLYEIEDMAESLNDMRIKCVNFKRFIGKVVSEITLSEEEQSDVIYRVDNLIQEGWPVAMGGCFPLCFSSSFTLTCCPGGVSFCVIDSNGDVKPCTDTGYVAGNVLKKPVKDIWKSPQMRKWRDNVAAECRKCDLYYALSCFGGCKCSAEKINASVDPLIKEPVKIEPSPLMKEINVEEELCPLPRYKKREEKFGCILIHNHKFLPVKKEAEAILNAIDGETSLRTLDNKFGHAAIAFVYDLYLRKFLVFRHQDIPLLTRMLRSTSQRGGSPGAQAGAGGPGGMPPGASSDSPAPVEWDMRQRQ